MPLRAKTVPTSWTSTSPPETSEVFWIRVWPRLSCFLLLAVFIVLCEQFQPFLQRGSVYKVYLHRIGQFFGELSKQTSSNGGSLENMLSRLMGSSEQKKGEESQNDSSLIELHTSCLSSMKMPMASTTGTDPVPG